MDNTFKKVQEKQYGILHVAEYDSEYYKLKIKYLGDYERDKKDDKLNPSLFSIIAQGKNGIPDLNIRIDKVTKQVKAIDVDISAWGFILTDDMIDHFKSDLVIAKSASIQLREIVNSYINA